MNALIVVDMQPDFLPGGALAVPGGDLVIPVINNLMHQFDILVATQDWHPPGHGSFASSHPGKNPFDVIDLNGLEQVLWPDHCVQGTSGAQIASEVFAHPISAIFRKGTDPGVDSYSGFYDNGRRKSTGLAGYLREVGAHKVFVCGLAADFCVYYTAADALVEGFETVILSDATKAINPAGWEKAQQDIRQKGGTILSSADWLQAV